MKVRLTASTRLTTKGQVVIPKAIRSQLRWKAGARLLANAEGDVVTLRRSDPQWIREWLREVAGCVKHGDPVGDLEAEHRREVEADARRRP